MQRLTPPVLILLACVLVALVLVGLGGARSAESVTCSSRTVARDSLGLRINLTGTWTADEGPPYYLRQVGTCLFADAKDRSNVFFGTVSSSTVTGIWTDVRGKSPNTTGTLTLRITSRNTVLLPRGDFPKANFLRKST
jgi:hypothetical protein